MFYSFSKVKDVSAKKERGSNQGNRNRKYLINQKIGCVIYSVIRIRKNALSATEMSHFWSPLINPNDIC